MICEADYITVRPVADAKCITAFLPQLTLLYDI